MRPDLEIISRWIKPRSRVLDLGCGDGTLLNHLERTREVTGYGLEIDPKNVVNAIHAGVNVIQLDIDQSLGEFEDQSFDYVVMTQALQVVQHPDRLLGEMLRIGRKGIVTFPNFGHWKCRIQLAIRGRMPISDSLPNQWYDTQNIHLCTVRDFEQLCHQFDYRILNRRVVDSHHRSNRAMQMAPNLLGEIALYGLCSERNVTSGSTLDH
ncbi:MAG: methionine biosynthesis protein MetW [Pseudomonadota bacterium]|nr:methionine biosynthesis protein MetW [Pseudomonadota bacterium]